VTPRALGLLVASALLLLGGAAQADDAVTRWEPRRELRIGTADYVVTGSALAGLAVGLTVVPSGAAWRGGILYDDAARGALRLDGREARATARSLSDVGVASMVTWPILADALVTAWWYRGREDVALEMAVVSSEAFAVGLAFQSLTNLAARRERPFGSECNDKDPPVASADCAPNFRYRSFFSGHATTSFAGASLVCVDHLGMGLLGQTGDVLSCVGSYAVATMTSLARVMADVHYASDVTIGALVGTAVGVGLPLLHFRAPSTSTAAKDLDVRVAPVGQGVGLVGTF
jgi:membrane-associated phospholipid phosphatase